MNATQTLYKKVLTLPMLASYAHTRAWVILPGGGSHEAGDSRLTEAPWDCNTVLVAGTRGDPEYSLHEVTRLLRRDRGVPKDLHFQGFAKHTPDQMFWVVLEKLLGNPTLTHLFISTAEYHLPRAALTFVKTWQTHGDCRVLRLSVAPTSNPRNTEGDSSTSQTIKEELSRIEEYQAQGDVATAAEFASFFNK